MKSTTEILQGAVGEVLGEPHPDWPEWCVTFNERKAYQQGVADARELMAHSSEAAYALEAQKDEIKDLRRETAGLEVKVTELTVELTAAELGLEALQAEIEMLKTVLAGVKQDEQLLQARFMALEGQEPVAYRFTENRGNGNTEFSYYGLDEVGLAYRDNCLEITPLFLAAGAAPKQTQPTTSAQPLTMISSESLPPEFQKILVDNLWELYSHTTSPEPKHD